jgi:hypothetical protein
MCDKQEGDILQDIDYGAQGDTADSLHRLYAGRLVSEHTDYGEDYEAT